MLSESQERMLMILKQGSEKKAERIFEKWDLDFSIIGKITNTEKITLLKNNKVICNLPLNLLVEDAPEYHRDYKLTSNKNKLNSKEVAIDKSIKDILYKILGHVNFCSKNGFMNNMIVLSWETLF